MFGRSRFGDDDEFAQRAERIFAAMDGRSAPRDVKGERRAQALEAALRTKLLDAGPEEVLHAAKLYESYLNGDK